MVIGDVSGHGFDSAIVMAQTRALLRAAARDESDPARLLSAVNTLLAPDLGENRFVSMITVDLDPRTRAVRWANAGHVPGYVLDGAGRVKAELASTGVVLGLFPDAPFTTQQGPPLDCGDLLVLFTDGVTEAEAPDGTMCGAEWALDVVRAHAHRSSAEILEALCDEIKAFADGATQHDDVTAIVCRVGEGGPPPARKGGPSREKRAPASRARAGWQMRGSARRRPR
jgi:sigma-B regulation protein RsbU (phosphoserine phosphatase)